LRTPGDHAPPAPPPLTETRTPWRPAAERGRLRGRVRADDASVAGLPASPGRRAGPGGRGPAGALPAFPRDGAGASGGDARAPAALPHRDQPHVRPLPARAAGGGPRARPSPPRPPPDARRTPR